MDEAAAAAAREGVDENESGMVERSSPDYSGTSTEDNSNRDEIFCCWDCGEAFREEAAYLEHRHQHSEKNSREHLDPQSDDLHDTEKYVCQLQKKAFQCKECGLKFSRASALHSHQLHHTDVYGETEKEAQMSSFPLPHQKFLESKKEEIEHCEEAVNSDSVLSASMTEVDRSESDEDMDSYEPGDFNVQVISASESEDEVRQDQNPDLELLCESDQEGKYYIETEVSPTSLVSKPEMDLKIVQIDFEQAEDQCAPVEAEDEMTAEKHDCPECYRWFSSASSLRVHRMWHDVRKRRQHAQVKQCNITRQDCGQNFTCSEKLKSHRQDHVSEEKRDGTRINTETGEERNSAERLISWTVDDDDNKQPKINQLDWSESNLHKDPEYWEWECVECDMGFDEEAKLHLHYVKHATGELPMPQDEFNDVIVSAALLCCFVRNDAEMFGRTRILIP
ncbi:hypothetical protein LDENG_00122810 [Lucifuga dentata]|nr:hypothetical protein LDENG_00122810 [Lucifuga dentata]